MAVVFKSAWPSACRTTSSLVPRLTCWVANVRRVRNHVLTRSRVGPRLAGMAVDWTAVAAVAALVTAVITAITVRVLLRQTTEMTQTRYADVALQLHRDYAGYYKEREIILNELRKQWQEVDGDPERLPERTKEAIARVVSLFERAGAAVDQRLIHQDLLYDLVGLGIVELWHELEEPIKAWRLKKRESLPDVENRTEIADKYDENFALLAEMYPKWVASHPPKNIDARVTELLRRRPKSLAL